MYLLVIKHRSAKIICKWGNHRRNFLFARSGFAWGFRSGFSSGLNSLWWLLIAFCAWFLSWLLDPKLFWFRFWLICDFELSTRITPISEIYHLVFLFSPKDNFTKHATSNFGVKIPILFFPFYIDDDKINLILHVILSPVPVNKVLFPILPFMPS